MAVDTAVASGAVETDDDARRPLMTSGNIAWMNLGFFGVQFSFGLTQTAVNPIFLLLGAEAHDLPILNIAGPITGLLIQPLIGAMSDKTWSPRWGRRKPYVLGGGALMILILFLFPLVSALWMAVICLWLVDAGNNTAMEPYRALISDRLRKIQIPRGFLTQSLFTGAGAVLANVSLFVMQKLITGATGPACPTGCSSSSGSARQRHRDDRACDVAHEGDRADPGGARAHPLAVQGARRDGQGHRAGGARDADRHAQDRDRVPVPVVRDVHLLAVRERQRR
jgi:hypothetical protein